MTLTLKIINGAATERGANPELVLNNRGANIGRSLTCEWVLPDESRVVSSKHCEIQFRDNAYFLIDYGSTNGTFVGTSDQRLEGAHRIAPSDRFRMGPYVIEARLSGAALQAHEAEQENVAAASQSPAWQDWGDVPGGRPAAPPAASPAAFPAGDDGWDLPGGGIAPDRSSIWSEDDSRSSSTPSADDIFSDFTAKNEIDWANASWSVDPAFDPFAVDSDEDGGFAPLPGGAPAAPADSSGFGPLPDMDQPQTGGGFTPLPGAAFASPPAPAPPPAPPSAAPPPPAAATFAPIDGTPSSDPFGTLPGSEPGAEPSSESGWPDPVDQPTIGPWGAGKAAPDPGSPPADPASAPPSMRVRPSSVPHAPPAAPAAHAPPPPPDQAPTPAASGLEPTRHDAVFRALLAELGVPASQVKLSPEESAAKTGRMLRHLLAGLMILLEARARAKDEMGAAGTALGFDGNNPLKFARNVDQALQMMLNPKLRGYMEAEDAIEEAYRDLQAHQIATLKAMQGALRETLNRFSPTAIKARTKEQGLLAKVLPGQREAALWRAYEAQFSGVAEGSAEAFLEVFSREFRKAYDEASQRPRH